MDLRSAAGVARAVWKMIFSVGQNQIAEFVDAHCVPDLEVDIWALVCEVRNEDIRLLNESNYLALEQAPFVMSINPPWL